MKETEKMKKVREALALLNRRMERLTKEINGAMSEIVVRQEMRLVQEALTKLQQEYGIE